MSKTDEIIDVSQLLGKARARAATQSPRVSSNV